MAQQINVVLSDDINGTVEEVETINFGLDGVNYEIDLGHDNETRLRDALAEFIGAARKLPRNAKVSPKRGAGAAAPSRERSAAAREWAKANGKQVSERGRVPAELLAEYDEAMAKASSKSAKTDKAEKSE